MKQETVIVSLKCACYLVVGIFTPWAASLAQWANSGEWPEKIVWIGIILPASAISGASSLLAFLSSSYSNYQKTRTGNTEFIAKP